MSQVINKGKLLGKFLQDSTDIPAIRIHDMEHHEDVIPVEWIVNKDNEVIIYVKHPKQRQYVPRQRSTNQT